MRGVVPGLNADSQSASKGVIEQLQSMMRLPVCYIER